MSFEEENLFNKPKREKHKVFDISDETKILYQKLNFSSAKHVCGSMMIRVFVLLCQVCTFAFSIVS